MHGPDVVLYLLTCKDQKQGGEIIVLLLSYGNWHYHQLKQLQSNTEKLCFHRRFDLDCTGRHKSARSCVNSFPAQNTHGQAYWREWELSWLCGNAKSLLAKKIRPGECLVLGFFVTKLLFLNTSRGLVTQAPLDWIFIKWLSCISHCKLIFCRWLIKWKTLSPYCKWKSMTFTSLHSVEYQLKSMERDQLTRGWQKSHRLCDSVIRSD